MSAAGPASTPRTHLSAAVLRLSSAHPQCVIACLAVLSRLIPWVLLHLLGSLPAFDSSAELLSGQPGSATLRWDAIHFAAIAKEGYQHEQQIAFQPGWPLLLRAVNSALPALIFRCNDMARLVKIGEALACASYVGAAVMLYRLTALISAPRFAFITSMLYLLPPAPAVMSSAFTEPLFALLTFAGFYFAVKRRYVTSSLFLAGATSLRATGVLAVGPVVWMAVFGDEPLMRGSTSPKRILDRCAKSITPAAIIVAPFALSQTYFYYALCRSGAAELWCRNLLPLPYSHVQEKFWNVGLLNYWTPAQIPNLILALPVLLISFLGAYRFARSAMSFTRRTTPSSRANDRHFIPTRLDISPATTTRQLLPFYIHSFALSLLLLFSAHTQIALRVCVTDPVVWWSLAGLAFNWKDAAAPAVAAKATAGPKGTRRGEDVGSGGMTPIGKAWIRWTVIYGAIGIVLWAGHYPPA